MSIYHVSANREIEVTPTEAAEVTVEKLEAARAV